jgi:hypothetical protein
MVMGEGVANGSCLFCFCILFIAGYYVMVLFVLKQCLMLMFWLVDFHCERNLKVLQVGFRRRK